MRNEPTTVERNNIACTRSAAVKARQTAGPDRRTAGTRTDGRGRAFRAGRLEAVPNGHRETATVSSAQSGQPRPPRSGDAEGDRGCVRSRTTSQRLLDTSRLPVARTRPRSPWNSTRSRASVCTATTPHRRTGCATAATTSRTLAAVHGPWGSMRIMVRASGLPRRACGWRARPASAQHSSTRSAGREVEATPRPRAWPGPPRAWLASPGAAEDGREYCGADAHPKGVRVRRWSTRTRGAGRSAGRSSSTRA